VKWREAVSAHNEHFRMTARGHFSDLVSGLSPECAPRRTFAPAFRIYRFTPWGMSG
jgi:hypothetical protein